MSELFKSERMRAGHISDAPMPGDYLTPEVGPDVFGGAR